jgi:hypothetical protein
MVLPVLGQIVATDDSWRLRGTERHVASVVAGAFVVAALVFILVDRMSAGGWDSPLLQAWTLVPQALAAAALLYIGKVRRSTAFWIMGILVGLIFIEEAFRVMNPVESSMRGLVSWVSERLGASRALVSGLFVYGFVAVVGLGLLALSLWHGSHGERKVVRNLALMLAIGGFFGGPVAVLSTLGDQRMWMFVEEVGEAIVFAVIAAYVAGLLYAVFTTHGNGAAAPEKRS